ncbi:hypothetical protein IE3_03802 [Bacillus cereus BAG3X2-1]|nr:hypothetical protein IE3_03802 [Bacillus cereus BAG3X2-1]
MRKRPQKGSPRWMKTFTDLTMLLLIFFVLLVATSKQDIGVSIVIVDNLIFDTGDANVKPEEKEVISQLVGFFQSVPNPILWKNIQIVDRFIMKNTLPTWNYLQRVQLI